ncbi:MAG: Asp-tRNA(Asn)/Glu-tRNA(Gln) amidotransferase subunit GatC [Patescibacteria group bacterium]
MINKALVEKVADLAKLEISEDDKKKYTKQLSDVFKYFDELRSLDLSEVPETSNITGLYNVSRPDEVHLIYSVEHLLADAPEIEAGQIKVPGVMRGKK